MILPSLKHFLHLAFRSVCHPDFPSIPLAFPLPLFISLILFFFFFFLDLIAFVDMVTLPRESLFSVLALAALHKTEIIVINISSQEDLTPSQSIASEGECISRK